MIKAVVFDVEGTLLDSIEARALAWRDALREFGANVDPASLTPVVAGPEREVPRRFLEPAVLAEVTSDAVIARYRDAWENVHAPRVQPIPMGRELVEALREVGLRVVLATRAHPDRVHDVIKRAGLDGLVDATGDPDGTEDEVLAAAAALAEHEPGETLAVVHADSDARAAVRLGMPAIGLLSGGGTRETLEAAGVRHIFASPEEMLQNLADLAPLGFPTRMGDAPRSQHTVYAGPTG